MAGPWERYQQAAAPADGPWAKYAQPAQAPAASPDAPASFDDRFNALSDEAAFRAVEPPKQTLGDALMQTWPVKVAKSIAGAVTLPGDVMAGKVDPRSDEAIGRSFDLAGVASPLSAAGKVLPKVTPKAAPAKTPTSDELKAAAKAGFESPEVAALEIKPAAMTGFGQSAKLKLNEAGIDENLAPEVFGVLSKLEKVPGNAFVSGKNIQSFRRMLGNAATSPDPTKRKAASMVMDELDDFVPNIAKGDIIAGDAAAAGKTLETARANYAAAKQSDNIDAKRVQAELRASAANSGMNTANTIRQRMADIAIDPKKQRGLTADEVAGAEAIARGTTGQNSMRIAGNVMGGGGGIGAALTGGGGALAFGPAGVAIPITGFALKSLSNRMTIRQAEQLSEKIRSRAPLASAMRKFEEKAAAFDAGRDSKTFAGVALAARNFSTNLKSAGINISPTELLTGLQGGKAARAEDE